MRRALAIAVLVVMALVPVVLVAVVGVHGLGISQDSVSYVAAARSLAASGELSTYTGEPLTLFPFGLPLILGVSEWLGWQAESAAVLLNAVCGSLLVLGAFALSRMAGLGQWISLGVAAFVSLSSTTIHVHAMVWSEPLFSVLVLAALISMALSIKQSRWTVRSLVVVSIIVSAATLVRYVGFVLIPIAGLGAWLASRASERGQRWRWTLLTSVGASFGLLVAVVRNLSLGAGPLGERYPAARTLQGAVADTVQQLGSYLAPPESTMLTTEVGVFVVLLLSVGAWVAVIRRQAVMVLIAGFVGVYWGAMIWSQATTRLDMATDRLAFPAFAPMAVLAASALVVLTDAVADQFARFSAASTMPGLRRRGATIARYAVRLGVLCFVGAALALSFIHGLRFTQQAAAEGIALSSGTTSSPLAQAVRDLPGQPGVASNDPWTSYWVMGHGPALHLPPDPTEWPRDRIAKDLALLQERVADGSVTYAAVYDDGARTLPLASLEEAGITLAEVARYPDGTLYRVTMLPN